MTVFCITAVRNEARYLPGFLNHLRGHIDGIIALDDSSTDHSLELLQRHSAVLSVLRERNNAVSHGNETSNRFRLLQEAARLGARWVLCGDADERFEEAFLGRIRSEMETGERAGQHVRCLKIVNLWNSDKHYRKDGRCGPRWTPRMFRVPARFSQRPQAMHQAWFPPEMDHIPRTNMNAYLYHLRMIEKADRLARYKKFKAIDPGNRHQAIGYGHLIDEAGLHLKSVLPWRTFRNPNDPEDREFATDVTGVIDGQLVACMEADFDEVYYLNKNPDVQRTVLEGRLKSGWQHFLRAGRTEGRIWQRQPRLQGFDFEMIFNHWRAIRSSPKALP
jgi:hypothetical protein